jgi:hypothetical protein
MESDFYSDVVSVLYSYLDMKGTFHVEEIAFNVISQIVQDGEERTMQFKEAIDSLRPMSFSFSCFDPNGRSYEVNTELSSGFQQKAFKIECARLILESSDENDFNYGERSDKLGKIIGKRAPRSSMISYASNSDGKLDKITITTPSVSELKDFLSALRENIKAEQP